MQQYQNFGENEDEQYPYGRPNRPSTPIRTVVNGVYGTVASFEMTARSKDATSTRKLERVTKPSRGHTRASTMAQDKVLSSTLKVGLAQHEANSDLFKLKKFKGVTSRVGVYHANDAARQTAWQNANKRPQTTQQRQR